MSAVIIGGLYRDSLPVPHEPEITEYIPAGALTIGVAYRKFDPAVALANYTTAQIEEAGGLEALLNDEGLSFHVFSTDGLDEYLRFDCFDNEPHYHYIVPGVGNTFVRYDPLSNGPVLEWAAEAIRRRAPEMLRSVGANDLADSVAASADVVSDAVDTALLAARARLASV